MFVRRLTFDTVWPRVRVVVGPVDLAAHRKVGLKIAIRKNPQEMRIISLSACLVPVLFEVEFRRAGVGDVVGEICRDPFHVVGYQVGPVVHGLDALDPIATVNLETGVKTSVNPLPLKS